MKQQDHSNSNAQTTNLREKPQETEGQLQGHPTANNLGYAWLLVHYTHPSYEPLERGAMHTHAQALRSSSEHGFYYHLPEHTTPRNIIVLSGYPGKEIRRILFPHLIFLDLKYL